MSNSTAITEITPRIQLHTVLNKKKKALKITVVKDLLCIMNKTKIIRNFNQCIFSSHYVKFYERQCTKGNLQDFPGVLLRNKAVDSSNFTGYTSPFFRHLLLKSIDITWRTNI